MKKNAHLVPKAIACAKLTDKRLHFLNAAGKIALEILRHPNAPENPDKTRLALDHLIRAEVFSEAASIVAAS